MLNEDLKKWLNQKWVRINTSGNIEGDCGTSKRKSNPNRCLPLSKARSLTKSQRRSTALKKKSQGKSGKQFVKNTKAAKVTTENVDRLINEYIGDELTILKSFEFKNELCPDIFSNNKLIPEIRQNLLDIVEQFKNFLDFKISEEDVVLTGSIANYNWSDYSDIDLHLIVDFNSINENKDLLAQYFISKKSLWNDTYPIKIKNFDVELYVEDVNDLTVSSGQYSVKNDSWIVEPKKVNVDIDYKKIQDKSADFIELIDTLVNSSDDAKVRIANINKLKNKLKNYRKSGLSSNGEYSYENLVYKFLRRGGYLNKLIDLKKDLITKYYSMNESKKKAKRDRCYYRAVKSYGNKTSAYRSLAIAACRKGKIWKKKSLKECGCSDDRNDTIQDFVNFCTDTLSINAPKIKLHTEPREDITSFGGYLPNEETLEVVVHNRNLADILRTVAHELVHHKQNLAGMLNASSGQDGSKHENQANAIAGVLMRIYSKNNPHIYE
jgi:predicted nucleotidyltransferase